MQNNMDNLERTSRRKRVIPFPMEGASGDSQFSPLFIGDYFAGFILRLIQFGLDGQPFASSRMTDQIDYGQVIDQGASPPVFCNVAKHPVLNLVPLTGARRKMAHV